MFTKQDKFNISYNATELALRYIESKPETLFCYKLAEAKNVLRWEYLTTKGIQSKIICVNGTGKISKEYCCSIINNKIVPYNYPRFKEADGTIRHINTDYVLNVCTLDGISVLMPEWKLSVFLRGLDINRFKQATFKSYANKDKTVVFIPWMLIHDNVKTVTRKLM